jgi:hypothetical protein
MQYSELSQEERDRLRAAYDAGFSAGSCWPSFVPDQLIDLVEQVAADWFASLETMQEAQRARYAFPGDEVLEPAWLRAEAERQVALGDAQPPDSWLRRTMDDGRP